MRCSIEFDSTPSAFLVPFQDHVRDDLELGDAFDLKLRLELLTVEWRHREVIVLAVGAAEVNLLITVALPLYHRSHSLDDDHVFGAWLLL